MQKAINGEISRLRSKSSMSEIAWFQQLISTIDVPTFRVMQKKGRPEIGRRVNSRLIAT
jgi:hypothetical protein